MEANNKNIKALQKILSDYYSRIIAIYYDTKDTAHYIEKLIKGNLKKSHIKKIDLASIPKKKLFIKLQDLTNKLNNGVLLIYGLEKVGFEFSHQKHKFIPTDILLQLNLNREKFFASRSGKIIFMVPRSYRAYLKMNLADFWDWIYYHIEFSQADFKGGHPWKVENKGNELGNLANSFLSTKEEIKKLERDIKALKKKNYSSKDLKNKLNKVINLYMTIGQLSQAKQWIEDFIFILIEKKKVKELLIFFNKLVEYYIKKSLIREAKNYQIKFINILNEYFPNKNVYINKAKDKLKKIN